MQVFTPLLALAAAGARRVRRRRAAAPRPLRRIDDAVDAVDDAALWIAFLVAAVATAGSLYFSEVANYIPCRLCWFQRIAMYPLAVILLVAAIRRDRGVRWYVVPLAASAPACRCTTTSSSGTRSSRATPVIRPTRARSCGSASSASSRWR